MALQVIDLTGKIVLYGSADTRIQEFSFFRAVEIAIKIGRVIQDLHIPIRCRPPLDKGHQRRRMCLQRVTVFVDTVQHDGRNRKNHARRRETALGKHMMNKAPMQATVSVLKRMNIDTIGDLIKKGEADLLKVRNFGKKSLLEVKEVLEKLGLSLGMEVESEKEEASTEEEAPEEE